jgi:hypothetical protein
LISKTICKNSEVFIFTIFVTVLKLKRHIALFFSSLAIMVLLLHGMMPHHHHNSEAEKCKVEEHLTVAGQELINPSEALCGLTNCSEDHQSNAGQPHVCTLNIAASKQISVELVAVMTSFSFQYRTTQTEHWFLPVSDLFTPTVFSEVRSLRAPPVV